MMTTQEQGEQNLSFQLDLARAMEEHYRILLLLWKQRRQQLERQIPNDAFQSFIEELFNDESHPT